MTIKHKWSLWLFYLAKLTVWLFIVLYSFHIMFIWHLSFLILVTVAGQCEGDLPEKQMLQIRVMKKDPKSICVLKLDSVIMDTVTIASGNHFVLNSFDCNKDELEMTVNQTIGTRLCGMIHLLKKTISSFLFHTVKCLSAESSPVIFNFYYLNRLGMWLWAKILKVGIP